MTAQFEFAVVVAVVVVLPRIWIILRKSWSYGGFWQMYLQNKSGFLFPFFSLFFFILFLEGFQNVYWAFRHFEVD